MMALSHNDGAYTSTTQWIAWLMVVVAAIGIVDASFLTVQHYRFGGTACSLFAGCDIVTTSEYATIAGVPVSVGGLVFYSFIVVLAAASLTRRQAVFVTVASWLTFVGAAATVWFVYVQLVVLRAVCLYCMVSALTSLLLLLLGIWYLVTHRSMTHYDRGNATTTE